MDNAAPAPAIAAAPGKSPPRRLYMDNAATSFPKPATVHEAMRRYAAELGASPGRGAYAEARDAGRILQVCRQRINTLIHGERPEHVVFTLNTTDALNLAIRGLVEAAATRGRPGHMITTWLDHNSVLRPANALSERTGLEQTRVRCDPRSGLVDLDELGRAIRPNTTLIAVGHGSNVSGTIQPVAEIGRIARQHDVPLLVDAAQTLGHVPLDVQADLIDLLAFPGHKGLLGPLGTGGLYIRPGLERRMATVREGGTGSRSEHDRQPDFLPDRFEAGSHNAIGIAGLAEGVRWILEQGVERLWRRERRLIGVMIDALRDRASMAGLNLYGPPGADDRCAVFAIRIEGFDQPQALSDRLEERFGILTRSGLHCAPLAHRTFGTFDRGGCTRLSFGPFLGEEDAAYAAGALGQLCHQAASAAV